MLLTPRVCTAPRSSKLHDLDAALELMYYGWRGMTLSADQYLATLGLVRTIAFSTWSRDSPTSRSAR